MGIPSYYKRLIDRFPRLVKKGIRVETPTACDVLGFDFNCLVYQCIRAPGMPTYTAATAEAWEAALLEAVKKYTVGVWTAAGRPRDVLIAVDGVVPMAKIRQQRLRRFKSVWLAEQERQLAGTSGERWDTNAITPGTAFMERLTTSLHELGRQRGWSVSGVDEAGEGEQKIMAWLRGKPVGALDGKRLLVYGLDADLIVLSLLTRSRTCPGIGSWGLLREEIDGAKDGFGVLDIGELTQVLVPSGMTAAEYLLEYTCAMSFLGNDFLPHSLSVKLRDNGHDVLCYRLTDIHQRGLRLVSPEGVVNYAACAELIEPWGAAEEQWIAEAFEHKYRMRKGPARSETEKLLAPLDEFPLQWFAEGAIWARGAKGLCGDWREVYRRQWLHGADVWEVGQAYKTGLQWIMDYYTGKPVSYSWYFPWNVPPTWFEQRQALLTESGNTVPVASAPVAPQEQLAMVLPMASWTLIRDPRLRGLPSKAPYLWPEKFGFFSVGRRWMWECEAEVPVISVGKLKHLLS